MSRPVQHCRRALVVHCINGTFEQYQGFTGTWIEDEQMNRSLRHFKAKLGGLLVQYSHAVLILGWIPGKNNPSIDFHEHHPKRMSFK